MSDIRSDDCLNDFVTDPARDAITFVEIDRKSLYFTFIDMYHAIFDCLGDSPTRETVCLLEIG
ncbi:hypothetical protein KAZ93_03550 [Patescibacteria group bacterium]|nr:hypothetical protein [Patescibacteria group bacterium]